MSNQQNASPGQFAPAGVYGGVSGAGMGAGPGLAKDRDGNPLHAPGDGVQARNVRSQGDSGNDNNQNQEQQKHSSYEGYGDKDTTASGGFGLNSGGSSFSRANQMGAADINSSGNPDDTYGGNHDGNKTGASTPGYRKEGEDPDSQQFRGQNLAFSQKKNDDEPEI